MRIKANLTTSNRKAIILPKHYISRLQGFVYNLMDPFLRSFLHETGYVLGTRRFKLFCFSKLLGKFRLDKENFIFYPPVSLLLSSPKNEILESMAVGLVKDGNFYLGKNAVDLTSIEVMPQPDFSSGRVLAKMISPVTVYSSFRDASGSQKTYYYSPFEEKFSQLIVQNLRKKYLLVYGSDNGFEFKISPCKVRRFDRKIIIYEKKKGDTIQKVVIKGWLGTYFLQGSPETLTLAYDCGLGSKNSQGFGMWRVEKFLDNFSVSQNCKGAASYEDKDLS